MSARKTFDEREVIDAEIELRTAKTSGTRRLDLVVDLLERGLLTRQLLWAYGFGENMDGFDEGVRDAMGLS